MCVHTLLKYTRAIMLVLGTGIVAACTSDDQNATETTFATGEVHFLVSEPVSLKAGISQFQVGDSIGIYAVKRVGDGSVPALPSAEKGQANNAKWIKTATGWEPATPTDKVVWDQKGALLDFYAYYPYRRDLTDPAAITISVSGDQSTDEKFLKNELLRAVNAEGRNRGDVELKFAHALSLLDVVFSNVQGTEVKMEVGSVVRSATWNLGTNAMTAQDVGNITMWVVTPGQYQYQAMVPVQTVAKGASLFVCDVDGITSAYHTDDEMELKSGEVRHFNIKISD